MGGATAIEERHGITGHREGGPTAVDFRPDVLTLRGAATTPGMTALVRGPLASSPAVIGWAIDAIRPEPLLLSAHVWRSTLCGDAQPWMQVATQVEGALAERGRPLALGSLARADSPDAFVDRLVDALDDLGARTDRPIVVAVEGLHDADRASVELSLAMADRMTSAALIIGLRTDVPVERPMSSAIAELAAGAVCIDLTGDLPADPAGDPFGTAPRVERNDDARCRDDERSRTIMELAALSPRIEASTLCAATGAEASAVLDALDCGVGRGLLRVDHRRADGFEFVDEQARRSVIESMSSARRAEQHWALATALVGLHGEDPAHIHVLAGHAAAGVLAGDPNRAIGWLTTSGDAHREAMAFDAAEDAWSSALGLCTRFGVEPTTKLGVLLRLTNLGRRLGRTDADELARELRSVARRIDDPQAIGRAALASLRFPLAIAALVGGDSSATFPLAEAMRAVDSSHPGVRCRLLCAAIANEFGTPARRVRLLTEAEALARSAPADERSELEAQVHLVAALLDHGPVRVERDLYGRALSLPRHSDARPAMILVDSLHHLRAGNLATACGRLEELVSLEGTAPIEWASGRMLSAAYSQLGRHEDARSWAERSALAGRGTVLATHVDNDERLRLSSVERPSSAAAVPSPVREVGLGRLPFLPWHAQQAAARAVHDPQFARAVVAAVFDVAMDALLATPHHLPTMAFAGRAAAVIGDRVGCERAVEMLLPHADELLVVGRGGLVDGPIAQIVADAAMVIGADELADGMRACADRVCRRAGVPIDVADPSDEGAARAAALVDNESGWQLTYDGTTVDLPDLKGVRFIARLMAAPDRDLPVRLIEDPEPLVGLEEGRVQLLGLQDDIREAEEFNDTARLEYLQDRFDALVADLAAVHHFDDTADSPDAERVRVRVTKSIRAALDRIEAVHPAAAAHLRSAIQTGKTCRFTGSAVTWEVPTTAPAVASALPESMPAAARRSTVVSGVS